MPQMVVGEGRITEGRWADEADVRGAPGARPAHELVKLV
jgi:hypothetical protein